MESSPAVVATRDDVAVHVLPTTVGARQAIDLLDREEARAGGPLVDETERERLEGLASAPGRRRSDWHALLAVREGTAVGYAGVVLEAGDDTASGDLAPARDVGACDPVLAGLLDAVRILARADGAARVAMWLRHATEADVDCIRAEGLAVDRWLVVLGRALDRDVDAPPAPAGIEVRAFRPAADEDAVVELLARAYEGTPDGGWDRARFRAAARRDWFRADDLLVAEDRATGGAELAGLHWLKRRSATVGEVYNLAVHPDAQGRGLGPVLLTAGLAHLARTGCDEVVLWVDRANEAALRLYTSTGFTPCWDDVRFVADLGPGPEA